MCFIDCVCHKFKLSWYIMNIKLYIVYLPILKLILCHGRMELVWLRLRLIINDYNDDNEDYEYDNDDHEDVIEDNNHNHYEDNNCQRLTHRPMQGWRSLEAPRPSIKSVKSNIHENND